VTASRLNILVLSTFDGTDARAVRDFLFSFNAYSAHRYYYVFDCRTLDATFDVSAFDVIMIFWTVDPLGPEMSEELQARIATARATKVFFRQDEHRDVRALNEAMRRLGVQVMLTCVAETDHSIFYPRALVPSLEACYTVLPGYVPRYLERVRVSPDRARPIDIGYRSRVMPFYLGDLGHEKRVIARRFEVIASTYGLRADISIREEDRLYGRRWTAFLQSCRCVLGSPSGASVIDFTGDIRRECERYLALDPHASYEAVKARFFAKDDGRVVIDTVSPRVFEAAALGATMVHRRGAYGGILEADRHYVAVAPDYSNVSEVVDRIRDHAFCRQLAANAHADLVASGRFSYHRFVQRFDDILTRHARALAAVRRTPSSMAFYARAYGRHRQAIFPYRDGFVVAPSPRMAFEMLRHGLAWLPRGGMGPIASRLVQNPMNFATKALTTWRTALGTPAFRAVLHAYVRARGRGSRLSLFHLLDDLRKLDIIGQARQGILVARQPFAVSARLDTSAVVLTLTSVRPATDGVAPDNVELCGPPPLVVWDHSSLGHQVVYTRGRGRWLTATVGVGGVHRFDAIAEIERHVPGTVIPALVGILGVTPTGVARSASTVAAKTSAITDRGAR
jgi:hypothetical protein